MKFMTKYFANSALTEDMSKHNRKLLSISLASRRSTFRRRRYCFCPSFACVSRVDLSIKVSVIHNNEFYVYFFNRTKLTDGRTLSTPAESLKQPSTPWIKAYRREFHGRIRHESNDLRRSVWGGWFTGAPGGEGERTQGAGWGPARRWHLYIRPGIERCSPGGSERGQTRRLGPTVQPKEQHTVRRRAPVAAAPFRESVGRNDFITA